MSTIGVNLNADDRWEAGAPECGEDWCADCGDCLGCAWDTVCLGIETPNCPANDPYCGVCEAQTGRHVWLNSMGEAKV